MLMFSEAAAAGRHLHVLKWAESKGLRLDRSMVAFTVLKQGEVTAAKPRALSVLLWAREWACFQVAQRGWLNLLRRLRARDCPWDADTCAGAAAGGHLHVLQWVRAKGCQWDAYTCELAAANGHLHVLQWARGNGCPWDKRVIERARWRYPHIVEWARENGCPVTD